MARNKKQRVFAHNSATPGMKGDVQLNIAYQIWKGLGVGDRTFYDVRSFSEKDLSMKTWLGCTEEEWDKNPDYWKHQNDRVIAYIRQWVPGFKVLRVSDKFAKTDKNYTCKICKSDRKHAIKKQKHLLSISAGCTVKAIDMNETFKLGTDIGKEMMQGIKNRLPNYHDDDDKNRLALEATVGQAYAAGFLAGKKQAAQGVLEILNEK